jgi:outer membrane immunogenic protein
VAYPGFVGPPTATIHQEVKTDWLFTARPRVGFTSNNVLVYGTGGVAITNLRYNNTYMDTFNQVVNGLLPNETESANVSQTKVGWTAGGGVEAGLGGNWSAKAEYLYVNFGTISSTAAIFPVAGLRQGTLNHSANLNASIVRVGLNYRFGGPVVANY